ncbi:1319_t:CDS:2 [Entrophospora sp. SA101]|nr:1319_t:CDS:2 [Entrophospora sp. SA101]CAJ0839641.1 10043_t:CDS:2 [Entrophospora sp. SA101]
MSGTQMSVMNKNNLLVYPLMLSSFGSTIGLSGNTICNLTDNTHTMSNFLPSPNDDNAIPGKVAFSPSSPSPLSSKK